MSTFLWSWFFFSLGERVSLELREGVPYWRGENLILFLLFQQLDTVQQKLCLVKKLKTIKSVLYVSVTSNFTYDSPTPSVLLRKVCCEFISDQKFSLGVSSTNFLFPATTSETYWDAVANEKQFEPSQPWTKLTLKWIHTCQGCKLVNLLLF